MSTSLPPIRPPLDREAAAGLYQEGRTVKEVAHLLGYAYCTVHKALREQGLGPRPPVSKTGKWARELYRSWKGMRSRCRNQGNSQHESYAAREVDICAEWKTFPPFHEWALASGFRPKLDLGLVRSDRDFSPQNCLWRTRSDTVRIAIAARSPTIPAFGETKTLVEWVGDRRCNVSHLLLKRRLHAGHEPEIAMSMPSGELRGAPRKKRSNPILKVRPRDRKAQEIDWTRIEKEWRAHPTTFAEVARRPGVAHSTVKIRLDHLADLARRTRILPADDEANLRKLWHRLMLKENDPSDPLYQWIGAKGIRLCRAWKRFDRFLEWAATSGYRPGLWLGRLDRRKDYSPSNCRWMSPADAMRRPKHGVKPRPPRWPVKAFGETRALTTWAFDNRCLVTRSTLLRRMRAGWEAEKAITTPPNNPGPPAKRHVSAFGERKTLIAWSQDPRCRISQNGLERRLKRGVPAEKAITSPAFLLDADPGQDRSSRPRARKKSDQ